MLIYIGNYIKTARAADIQECSDSERESWKYKFISKKKFHCDYWELFYSSLRFVFLSCCLESKIFRARLRVPTIVCILRSLCSLDIEVSLLVFFYSIESVHQLETERWNLKLNLKSRTNHSWLDFFLWKEYFATKR